MNSEDARLSSLLAYVQVDGRICPQPDRWNQLWERLPNKQRVGGGWNPPLPLILAAWHDTTALEKMLRLKVHIEYAHQNGVFNEVDAFLRGLRDDDWYRTTTS
jgi:hypothetical protein